MQTLLPHTDTIAAIATAPGRGGVGIVRLSGAALRDLACQFNGGRRPQARVATLAAFCDADGGLIDRGLLLYFPAPHSFTGEDVIELHAHGGPVVLQLLLRRCLALGARLAQPGEFTRRAFLNGKLDLTQAESVADLIDAASEAAVRAAARSLTGAFSAHIEALVEQLKQLRLELEAALDFPEEEIDFISGLDIDQRLQKLRQALAAVLARARHGARLNHGLQVVLAGCPNVGKSSLLNALAGQQKAIVTEHAGTTRDVLAHSIVLDGGLTLHLLDTAGLRESSDPVEQIGIARAWQEIEGADLVLRLIDAAQGVSAEDEKIDARLPAQIARLLVYNKIDLTSHAPGWRDDAVYISARDERGLDDLRRALLEIAGLQGSEEDALLARTRHVDCLQRAAAHVEAATQQQHTPELLAEDLRLAHDALGEITGACTPDDLLGAIFSHFCIGK